MSVQSTARYAGPFAGNGVTTVFAFGFKVFAASDIVVASTVAATGVVSNPVNGVDYTVQLNADQNVNPGGTITYAVAPPATVSPIYITSSIPKAQLSSFPNPGPWNPTTGESAWDKSMTIIQEIGQAALLFAPGDVASTHILPSPAARKNTVIGFDANGVMTLGALAGFVLSTAVAGQIAFGGAANTLTQDSNLFWDNTAKRLGIGNAAPTTTLDVTGAVRVSSSIAVGTAPVASQMLRLAADHVAKDGLAFVDLNAAPLDPWLVGLGSGSGTGLNFYHVPSTSIKLALSSTGAAVTGVLSASTSVVTPLVGTATAVNLGLVYNGTTQFNVNNVGFFPAIDNTMLVGSAASRIAQFTGPILDSGVGSLVLKGAGTSMLTISSVDIQWNRANVALGGGAAPTVGTIGGAGPAAAAQRNWLRFIESDGTASFIPVWR